MPLAPEARAVLDWIFARAAAASSPSTYSCKAGTIHGFLTMGKVIPAANGAITEAASSLAAALTR